VLSAACPLLSDTMPRTLDPSVNVTVPVGVPPSKGVTVAVNVTDWAKVDGFSDEVSAVAEDQLGRDQLPHCAWLSPTALPEEPDSRECPR